MRVEDDDSEQGVRRGERGGDVADGGRLGETVRGRVHVCRGYMGVPMGIELMLCLIGSFTSVFVFRESSTLLAAGRRFGVSTWASEIPEEEDKSELRGNGEESSDGGSLCVVPVQTGKLVDGDETHDVGK